MRANTSTPTRRYSLILLKESAVQGPADNYPGSGQDTAGEKLPENLRTVKEL
jgi:hypothetical protein